MSRIKDISGKRFGNWYVEKLNKYDPIKQCTFWWCRCLLCNKLYSVRSANLISGASTKCQECNGSKFKDLTGKIFGNWKVLKFQGIRRYLCQCKCGKKVLVLNYHLLSGASTQCRDCYGSSPNFLKVGSKYNKLTVKKNFIKNGQVFCRCLCDCGHSCSIKAFNLKNNLTCSCSKCCNFKGYYEISLGYFGGIKRGAFNRGLEFDITIEDIWNIYIKQNKKCILTGLDICFVSNNNKCRLQTVSVDRINNAKGYLKDNIQLVHKSVNLMRHKLELEEFIKFCNLISKQHPRKI